MARDPGLEELLRADLPEALFTEKAMFGGWAWLLNGNLVCGARVGSLLLRLGKGNDAWALACDGVERMEMRGRRLQGWLRVGPSAYGDDTLRRRLTSAAVGFAMSLPAKPLTAARSRQTRTPPRR